MGIFVVSFAVGLSLLQGLVGVMDRAGDSEYTDIPLELVAVTGCAAEKQAPSFDGGLPRFLMTFEVEIDAAAAREATGGKIDQADRILVQIDHVFEGPTTVDSFPSTGSISLNPGSPLGDLIGITNEQRTSEHDSDHYSEDPEPECIVTTAFIAH